MKSKALWYEEDLPEVDLPGPGDFRGPRAADPDLGNAVPADAVISRVVDRTGEPQPTAPPMPVSADPPTPGRKPAPPSARKGGADYPVYAVDSGEAASFRSAFAAASRAGAQTFQWQGRAYKVAVK